MPFPDLETLKTAADAIDSNMFEGFEPTATGIAIIRDYLLDKITPGQLAHLSFSIDGHEPP